MFNSPCNPTGSVYTKDELKAIADVVAKYKNVYILSDEIYEHINFTGGFESFAQFDNIYERVITIRKLSGTFITFKALMISGKGVVCKTR